MRAKTRKLLSLVISSLLVFALMAAFVPAAEAQDSWWDRNWTKRRALTISPNSSGNIVVNVQYDSDMQPDFDDIRFLEDENSGVLQYFRENYRLGQDAVFIVSRPTANDSTIYMYYGNPNVGTTSLSWSGNIIFISTSLSSGWTRLSAMDSRFPRGSSSYGGTGGVSSHNHTFSGTTSSASEVGLGRPDTGSYTFSYAYAPHSHSFSGTTSTDSNIPPYLSVIFEKSSCIPREIDSTFIALFTSLPANWTRVSALDGRFPYGSSSYGATGGSETHTHTVSFTTGGPSQTVTYTDAQSGTDQERTTSTHTHSYSGTVSGSNIPPYLDMIYASPTSSSLLPNGMIAMFDSLPPLGWTRFTALDGKFPRGASTYGGTGGSSSHSHTISGTTSGASAYISDWRRSYNASGPCYAHTHTFTVTTSTANVLPPYMDVIFGQRSVSSSTVIFGDEQGFPNPPTSLLCVDQINPTRLSTLTPYFSAIYTDNDGDSGAKYRIQVTTDSTFATITHWDSGAVSMAVTPSGSRCPNITYGGASLSRGVTYYWRIKFWDNTNAEGAWSETATFRIAPVKYWVGGTGNWSDTAHWSTSSGGAGGASVPTSDDDVFFDANSGSGTVTVDSTAYAYNLNFTGFTGTLAGSAALNIYGSLTLGSGMTWSYTGAVTFAATSGNTLTFNGKSTNNSFTFNSASGRWTLQDDWNNGSSSITLTAGSLDTNGKTVTCGTFNSSNSNARTLTLGSSTINCTSWSLATTTNLNFDAGTSVIKCTGTFAGGGKTYYEVQLNASGSQSLTGANTFTNLKRTGGSSTSASLTLGASQTVTGTLTLTGASRQYQLLVSSDTPGVPRTITAANVSVANVDFMDIAGAGAANWNFSSRDDIGDCGGNSGITFPASKNRYWVGNGGYWYDTAHWSASSGGAPGASVPLPQDDVYFNAYSITTTGQTISANIARLGRNINFTGLQNTPTLNFAVANSIFGSLTLSSGMAISGTSTTTFQGRGSYTLTTAGLTFTQNIALDAPGGTLTLQGDLVTNNCTLTINRGTFDANGYNVVVSALSSYNSYTRTIKLGSGTWSLTGTGTVWNLYASGLTLDPGTSTIKLTNTTTTAKTFAGAGKTYYNFWDAAAGTVTITGSNTFNDFRIDAGRTVYFTAGTTTTVNSFTATGAPGSLITISSATSATHTLSKASGIVNCDYLSLSYSVAAGGATWYAGANSTDGGNNSGWRFMSAYTPPNPPSSLLCESQTNPSKLTTFTPRFSAIHTDNNAGDNNGDSAIKYRIQVSTDSTFATVTHWDTGASGTSMSTTASGSRCPDITYGGAPLSRGVTYYWRIKFWDATNVEGYWSQPASFRLNQLPNPANLLTQGQTNPTRLTTFAPTLSWSYTDPDGDAQSKYEIWVGTSQGSSDRWNSGQVSSSGTSVAYGGSSLSRGVTYYVQVRVYDGYEWSDWATGTFRINQLASVSGPGTSTLSKVYLYNYGTQDVQIDRLFISGTEVRSFVIRDASSGEAYGSVVPAGKLVAVEFPCPPTAEFDLTIITKNKGLYTWKVKQ